MNGPVGRLRFCSFCLNRAAFLTISRLAWPTLAVEGMRLGIGFCDSIPRRARHAYACLLDSGLVLCGACDPFSPPTRHMKKVIRASVIAVLLTSGLGAVGLLSGNALGYGIAWLTGRDPAELKDMLIWCFITTPIVFAAAGFLLAVRLITERLWARRTAIFLFIIVAVCSVAIIALTYLDAPRHS